MKFLLIITCVLIGIIVLLFLLAVWISADYEEKHLKIDNSDGHLICGNTNQPCIKDAIYMGGNDCVECPYGELKGE